MEIDKKWIDLEKEFVISYLKEHHKRPTYAEAIKFGYIKGYAKITEMEINRLKAELESIKERQKMHELIRQLTENVINMTHF